MPRFLDALARLLPRRTMTLGLAPDEKASRTGPLIALETLGRPVWTPRDYAAFAREGFMQNAVCYRAVRMIAEAAASIPLLLYDGSAEIEEHPLLDLVRRPGAGLTGTDLLEAWYGYLLVSGNAYLEAVAISGRVRELHALRPDRMKVVPGSDGWPEAWEYTAGGETVRFAGEVAIGVRTILHVKLFHPVNDHYGLSPIEAAATAIDIHNAAARWNKALLDNSARPSGALVYTGRDGRMTAEQFERLKGELETSYQGARHAGRPLLLEGGLDWKALSLSPKDMDFMEAKHAAAREIALALGVPPMLLGIPGDNTYSNYQEAQRAFWRGTVLPLVNRTAKALSAWLAPAFVDAAGGAALASLASAGTLELRPDLDQVEGLSGEREALWARLNAATFLTANERREAAGYDALEDAEPASDGSMTGDGQAGRADLHGQVPFAGKYRPDQPRAPRGDPEGGQWVDEGGGGGGQVLSDATPDDFTKPGTRLANAGGGRTRSSQQSTAASREARLQLAKIDHQRAVSVLRQLEPNWRGPARLTSNPPGIEAEISLLQSTTRAADARLAEITRDAVPNTNPLWGVNRLRKELNDRGFVLHQRTRAPGYLYRNHSTGEEVRIMERPGRNFRTESTQKHQNDYYYRYRPGDGKREGSHITIPNKD